MKCSPSLLAVLKEQTVKRDTKAIGAGGENTVQKKPEMFGHWPESFYVCPNDRKFPSSVENEAKNNSPWSVAYPET